MNSQHHDKDGLKEAVLRKKLVGIMSTYNLLEHFDDTQDPEKYKHHKAFDGNIILIKSMKLKHANQILKFQVQFLIVTKTKVSSKIKN